MADFFDISVKSDKQDALIQKIKAFVEGKKNANFDIINHRFSGGGVEGRWAHAGFSIRVYIDKKPFYVSVARIEKSIRELPLSPSIAHNFIIGVDADDNYLWVATEGGVSRGELLK